MKSSYTNNVNFGDIISTITFLKQPKKIVECGILEGFSLLKFIENSSSDTQIDAYDIFDEFNGNHSIKEDVEKRFSEYNNVSIYEGDFYDVYNRYPDKSIDILHIDIANNGDVYEHVFQKYIDKISEHGLIILEGGSEKRDNIEWMIKYNKPKIQHIINKYKSKYKIKVIGEFPSITIVMKE